MPSQSPFPTTPGPALARLVQGATDHLAEYYGALRPEQWELPSGAPGWTIADVMGHLTTGALGAGENTRRALKGDISPPPGRLAGPPHQTPGISQELMERAKGERQRLGPKLLETFQQRYSELQQLYASLAPDDWERPCFHRIHLQTIRGYVHLRLAEVSYHIWDLKAGLEATPRLLPEVIPALLEWLPTWFRWGFFPQEPLEHPLRYRFLVTRPRALKWDVTVFGDRFVVETPEGAAATTTFRCDGETAVLVFGSRVSWQEAEERGVLTVEGARGQADAFFQWFRGV